MNKTYLLLGWLPLLGMAQNNQGKIVFEEKIEIKQDLKLEGVENADQIRAMMPKSINSKKMLLFSSSASLYKNIDAGDMVNNMEDNGGAVQVKMVIARPDEQYYRDFKNNTVIEKHDLFGKSFLVADEKPAPWKITNEQKTIAGYPCVKALLKDSAETTEAWFTTEIPVSSGPGPFANLPGMVLMVNKDNGRMIIEAKDVKLGEDPGKMEIPTKGKKVSKKEYQKIMEEKNKEREEMGGNQVIIRHN